MFGISPLGWVHTLGSLPAIPLAVYMLARYGRIVPRSPAGLAYFVSMLIGALTVFLVAKEPAGTIIGAVTLLVLISGYTVGCISWLGRAAPYLETICLTLTVFLLMVPSVSETLTRVPDGHPLIASQSSPILHAVLGGLLVLLLAGLTAQLINLRRLIR